MARYRELAYNKSREWKNIDISLLRTDQEFYSCYQLLEKYSLYFSKMSVGHYEFCYFRQVALNKPTGIDAPEEVLQKISLEMKQVLDNCPGMNFGTCTFSLYKSVEQSEETVRVSSSFIEIKNQ